MSRSTTGWVVVLVVLGILIGIVGGGVMGGVVGYYVARSNPAVIAAPPSNPIAVSAVSAQGSAPAPVVTKLTVESTSAIVEAVRVVEPAVVTVISNMGGSASAFGGGQSSGSGVIIDAEGHIITNNHVVEGGRRVSIVFSDNSKAEASIVGTDPVTDIAVLKVEGRVPAYVGFGDSSALQLGEWVIAIGSPLGNYRGSVTVGVVSGMNRRVGGQEGLIQTDAAINHGNSGGPLVNLAGQIVGINTLVVRDSVGGAPAEGLGFAVPSTLVQSVAEQLISSGRIDYPFIGVTYTEVTPQLASEYNLAAREGVIVTQVTPGSPADRGGVQPQDIITAIDNNKIDEENTLRSILFQYRAGDEVTLTIQRGNQVLEIKIRLATRPPA